MLAAFLPPYPFRGTPAPFLWWYYRLLGCWSGEAALFLTGRDHVRPPQDWGDRWECGADAQARLGYRLPASACPPQHHYAWLDEGRFDRWLQAAGGNPIAVFRRFLTQRDPEFEQELHGMLSSAPVRPEAVLTVCNSPALEAVCAELGILVVHAELGPLRAPRYRDTGYVDFRGVNGNTEAAARFAAFDGPSLPLARQDLLRFFTRGLARLEDAGAADSGALGVVLQVEDDSNLVAFGAGMDNISLMVAARLAGRAQGLPLRVRPHPGSIFGLRDPSLPLDQSLDSFRFVQACARVFTINSSVGLEALLQGRELAAFGESSFAFVLEANEEAERTRRLAFYLLAYLVPLRLQVDPAYLRFRLGQPGELSIMLKHVEEAMKDQGLPSDLFGELPPHLRAAALVLFTNQATAAEERMAELQQALAERDRRIQDLEASASWRITAPLRWLHRLVVRR
jgi:hypothetical protein